MLSIYLGPYDDVGGGLHVGTVLVRDVRMNVGPHDEHISGTDQQRCVRPGRR